MKEDEFGNHGVSLEFLNLSGEEEVIEKIVTSRYDSGENRHSLGFYPGIASRHLISFISGNGVAGSLIPFPHLHNRRLYSVALAEWL